MAKKKSKSKTEKKTTLLKKKPTEKKKRDQKKKGARDYFIRPENFESAADLILDGRGHPIVYDYTDDMIKQIEAMAFVGLSNECIATVMGVDVDTFSRQIEEEKKRYYAGERLEFNIYAVLEKSRVHAKNNIARTAYDVAVKDRNPTMLIWLSKTRLKWQENFEIRQEHKHTFVYETQIQDGVLRKVQGKLGSDDSVIIDAMIDEVTEEVWQGKTSE